ncbi:hypothetical protein EMPG_09923 [Blastomyces silverae]|uniref:Uncharacterized protein n=1 Tax=Blastomyces silverae TaxID=2060906 RepID=A0A0H1BEN7_9EURO|nr:hypothetical protein EMPG_09923 [Blastomyces silverae]
MALIKLHLIPNIVIVSFGVENAHGTPRFDRLCEKFINAHPTEGSPISKRLEVAGQQCHSKIWSMHPGCYEWWCTREICRESQILIFKYDVTSCQGFNVISEWYKILLHEFYWRERWLHATGSMRLIARPTKLPWPKSPETFTCFPRLPSEIQLLVLRECLVSPNPVLLPDPSFSGININVLQTCKFFYQEGRNIFWGQNTFTTSHSFIIIGDTALVSPNEPRRVTASEGRALANGDVQSRFIELSSIDDHDIFRDLVMDACEEQILRARLECTLSEKEVEPSTCDT